ncbi:hypothetical protein [Prochlorococcus sp. MIT 1306]|uniref:hypothetical protein n=1 Tax=Prochlorococcus sp. MIT 1306 TaxID=1799667 RepID=UPI0007BC763C|nr:hypothetical protein [Prochlorococcus sp. MIT 1306]KZR65605.1 hypothetical protein PMIT1306_00517 [Prochlorococcus sp. MIT 1306]
MEINAAINNLNDIGLLHDLSKVSAAKLAAAELIKIHRAVITQQVLIAIFNKIKK